MKDTLTQFDHCTGLCREVFVKKLQDYGAAWRILRSTSITDQVYIKANRIRSIETKGAQMIDEGVKPEYIGLINYSVIALIQIEKGVSDQIDMGVEDATLLYDSYVQKARSLMMRKNHDYDEAWRLMRITSYTDLILQKIFRIKQIEDNQGATLISEGIDANYYDILNYSVFALIKIEFGN